MNFSDAINYVSPLPAVTLTAKPIQLSPYERTSLSSMPYALLKSPAAVIIFAQGTKNLCRPIHSLSGSKPHGAKWDMCRIVL